MSSKRQNYISKHEAYMGMAKIASMRSKDPNTQVGCVIVSDSDRILSIGYNGFPNGCSDDDFPWDRKAEHDYDTKYPYVVHSELNAILNFRGDLRAFNGASLYVTLFPCHECTKAIIQVGIKHIYYESNKYKDTEDYKEAKRMLDAVGIECVECHQSIVTEYVNYDMGALISMAEPTNIYDQSKSDTKHLDPNDITIKPLEANYRDIEGCERKACGMRSIIHEEK